MFGTTFISILLHKIPHNHASYLFYQLDVFKPKQDTTKRIKRSPGVALNRCNHILPRAPSTWRERSLCAWVLWERAALTLWPSRSACRACDTAVLCVHSHWCVGRFRSCTQRSPRALPGWLRKTNEAADTPVTWNIAVSGFVHTEWLFSSESIYSAVLLQRHSYTHLQPTSETTAKVHNWVVDLFCFVSYTHWLLICTMTDDTKEWNKS